MPADVRTTRNFCTHHQHYLSLSISNICRTSGFTTILSVNHRQNIYCRKQISAATRGSQWQKNRRLTHCTWWQTGQLQNTQTVDTNIDNKVLSEAERQLRVIYWEREKTHAVNLPFRQQVTMPVTTSDIPDVELDDVGRMTSSASQARSRWLLPTGPRSWIDPGTQNLCWMVSARFTLKMCIAA